MTTALRCPQCCEHGVPYGAWCGWCDDVHEGYADPMPADEQQWRCDHGVGVVPGGREDHS